MSDTFANLFTDILGQWQAEADQQKNPEALRAKALKDSGVFYKYGLPNIANNELQSKLPLVDILQEAQPAVDRLMNLFSSRGYNNILSESYPTKLFGSEEVKKEGARGMFERGQPSNAWFETPEQLPAYGVVPSKDSTKLTTTLLHELTHLMQANPETADLLKYHRENVQPKYGEVPDLEFAKKYPAITEHESRYFSDPREIQARGLANAMISDLLGVPEGTMEYKDPSHTLLLNQLLGRGYTPAPSMAKRPERF